MGYLTINDYDNPDTAIADCLNLALKIHKSFNAEVNFENQDKKHAIYLLVGSGIDSAFLAFDFYKKNQMASLLQLHRYLIEVRALVEYFLVDDSKVVDWFEGKFISGRLTKRNEDLKGAVPKKAKIPFHFPDEGNLLKVEKWIQEKFNFLSKFSHPTVNAVCLGFSPNDKALKPKITLPDYKFGRDFLPVLVTMINDAGRTEFVDTSEDNEVYFLSLSEFRVLFGRKSF